MTFFYREFFGLFSSVIAMREPLLPLQQQLALGRVRGAELSTVDRLQQEVGVQDAEMVPLL
jgi:hypothetical protein